MQLLIILALLLYGGKSGAQNLLTEVKPVLESIGGEEMREAIKSAEEISAVLSAVGSLTGANGGSDGINSFFGGNGNGNASGNGNSTAQNENAADFTQNGAKSADIAFPLKPISNIADRDITYSLSRYIMQG